VTIACLRGLLSLGGGAGITGHRHRFWIVGVLGMLVDLLIFRVLVFRGLRTRVGSPVEFLAATVFNYSFNARLSFGGQCKTRA